MGEGDISDLQDAVSVAIDQGRLGALQFMRCHALAQAPSELAAALNELESLAEAWFGFRPAQTYRLGEDSGVYITQMSKWDGGQGAIITVSLDLEGAPRIDLMLIGSRGTLYHQG